MKPCLNFGHTGAASNVGIKQMQNLKDVTDHVFEFFAQKDITFSLVRKVDGNLIPGGVGCFKFARAGEGIYYSNGLPIVFVTRLSSESGCDANVGKWYRKQWYYENYLRKVNPNCTHLTFIHASEKEGLLSTMIDGVSMVMAQEFNQHSFNTYNPGGNSIFYYDTDKGTDTWYDIQAKLLTAIRCSRLMQMKSKQDPFTI